MRRAPLVAMSGLLAFTVGGRPASASGPRHEYVIAIGYNGLPAGDTSEIQPLRFADDDAIAFSAFAAETARQVHLLTVPDAGTQRRLGDSLPTMRPPSLDELRSAVADVRSAIDEDARQRVESTVYLYYSGHGTAGDADHEPALALADGALTHAMLYDEILAEFARANVHVFLDACHAEAVVRPRDAEAHLVSTSEDDRRGFVLTQTLSRFPNTGAVVATARGAQAHEWDAYLGGVFTHELLSGLRGAADVNGDTRIEYSELAAFLSAANGSVRDPRARLEPVTHAPTSNPREPIVDGQPRAGVAMLEVQGVGPDAIFVEDDRANRLADVRPESGQGIRLLLPADRTWYVHTSRGVAEVRPTPGQRVDVGRLSFRASPPDARGAIDRALHDGLFATPFGWSYYRGFVDAMPETAPVPWSGGGAAPVASAEAPVPHHDPLGAWVGGSAGASAVLTAGAVVFGAMAAHDRHDYDASPYEVPASDAASRYTRDTAIAYALGTGAVVGAGVALYLSLHPGHPAGATASAARSLGFSF
jgi:Caspase domain